MIPSKSSPFYVLISFFSGYLACIMNLAKLNTCQAFASLDESVIGHIHLLLFLLLYVQKLKLQTLSYLLIAS